MPVVLKNGDSYSMQQFKWSGRGPRATGKERDITRRIYDVEDRESSDFAGDGIIGEEYSGKDPEVSRVIFPGNDEFQEGLYQLNSGVLVFAEPDLDYGDTPFEDEIISDKKGQPYPGADVVGVYPIKNGFALVEGDGGTYKQQGFRFKDNGGPKPYGKPRKVKDIDKIESRTEFDINNDGSIGGSKGGKNNDDDFGAEFRLIHPGDANPFADPLA